MDLRFKINGCRLQILRAAVQSKIKNQQSKIKNKCSHYKEAEGCEQTNP